MRILLVNAFHYARGGVERAYFDESRWLSAAGHEVGHLAIRDARNLPSPTASFFAPEADYGPGAPLRKQLAQLPRAIWSRPAAEAAAALAREFKPDVAHIHAPSRYLTPSVLRALERAGVPLVMTLHDFKLWCTNRVLFAHETICERCKGGRHYRALFTGCVQDSHLKSAIGALEAYVHEARGAYRGVRLWIAPSRFVREKATELGADASRIRLLPHGVERAADATDPPAALDFGERYVLYAGRLSAEKGVRLLPSLAMRLAPVPVLVAGDGPLAGWLAAQASSVGNLKLLGHRDAVELRALLAAAAVVLVPSLVYETFCYAAAEALLEARPVVASRLGAIPELVEHEVTGLLTPPGDAHALAEAVQRAIEDPAARRWAVEGHARVERLGEPWSHVAGLLEIYREALA